jgi:predicted RNA-binding protein
MSLITASTNLFGPSIPSHVGVQIRTRININVFQTRWEMCAARNASGALALLLSLDAKFVNKLQNITQYFNTHCNITQHLTKRVTISRYLERDLQSIMGDTQLFLQPQIQPYKETESFIKKNFFRSQRRPHRDHRKQHVRRFLYGIAFDM